MSKDRMFPTEYKGNKTFSIANARYFHSKDTARRVGRAVYYNQ